MLYIQHLTIPEPLFVSRMLGPEHDVKSTRQERVKEEISNQEMRQTYKSIHRPSPDDPLFPSPAPESIRQQQWFRRFQSVSTSKRLTADEAMKIVRGSRGTRARPHTAPTRRSPQSSIPHAQQLLAFDI